jgi:hypothetical protein
MNRKLIVAFLIGLVLGAVGVLLVEPFLSRSLPEAVRGKLETVSGRVTAKRMADNGLLLTVVTRSICWSSRVTRFRCPCRNTIRFYGTRRSDAWSSRSRAPAKRERLTSRPRRGRGSAGRGKIRCPRVAPTRCPMKGGRLPPG